MLEPRERLLARATLFLTPRRDCGENWEPGKKRL
jgi:hypothetical protein